MKSIILDNLKDIRSAIKDYNASGTYFEELINLLDISETRSDKVIFLYIEEGGEIIAAGLFSIDKRQVLGLAYSTLYLYGYSFFDYNQLYFSVSSRNEFIHQIKKYARSNAVDLIMLDNLKNSLLVGEFSYLRNTIQIFNSSLSENGFDFISKKKSLKRHRNLVCKDFDYKVEHLKGEQIEDEHFKCLARLHKERWGFDNIDSAFKNLDRISFYKGIKENGLMTILKVGDEVLAMHFGMLSKDRIIWHTPVLNIKYFSLSPIEVLLYETSEFCKENKIKYFDFGLGDEEYKNRFSNSEEYVFSYLIPVGIFTKIKISFTKLLAEVLNLRNLITVIKKNVKFLKDILNNNKLYFYKIKGGVDNFDESKELKFIRITKYADFINFARSYDIKIQRFHLLRFSKGNYFYCIYNDSSCFCSGWTSKEGVFISELNKFYCPNGYVMYDFNTLSQFRRKGYYKLLLKYIVSLYKKELYIYSLRGNKGSNKAIQSVGFNLIRKFKL
jgi:hypothetical protein